MLGNSSTAVDSAATPQLGAPSEPPDFLCPGGLVDRLLEDARQSRNGSEDVFSLNAKVRGDLQSVRANYANLASRQENASSEAELLVSAMTSTNLRGAFDAVLVVGLANISGVEVDRHVHDAAGNALSSNYDSYLAVLGRLIPDNYRDHVERQLARDAYQNGTNMTAAADWCVFLEKFDQDLTAGARTSNVKTGLPALDDALYGIEGVMFIGGTKGSGKTTLMLSMMIAALESDPEIVVLFYTLDLNKMRLIERLISHFSGVAYRDLKSGERDAEATTRIESAKEHVLRHILSRVRFVERHALPQEGLDAKLLRRDGVALMNHTEKFKLLVIIDPFQRVPVNRQLFVGTGDDATPIAISSDNAKDDFRLDQIKAFRDGLRTSGQPNGPPIIIGSEIPKSTVAGANRELTMDDLRGSGRIAADADTVLLMWPTKDASSDADCVPLTLKIAKGRDGVIRRKISLVFHHTCSKFEEAKATRQKSRNASSKSGVTEAKQGRSMPDALAEH